MTVTRRIIQLHWQAGVPEGFIDEALDASTYTFNTLRVHHRFSVRRGDALPGLKEVIGRAMRASKKNEGPVSQLDTNELLNWLYKIPGGDMRLLIVKDDLGVPDDEYVFGMATAAWGGVVSTYRFERDKRVIDPKRLFRGTVTHELGHVLGAVDRGRGIAVEEWFGAHCTNVCVMHQFDDLPDKEASIIHDPKRNMNFCGLCRRDIRSHLGM